MTQLCGGTPSHGPEKGRKDHSALLTDPQAHRLLQNPSFGLAATHATCAQASPGDARGRSTVTEHPHSHPACVGAKGCLLTLGTDSEHRGWWRGTVTSPVLVYHAFTATQVDELQYKLHVSFLNCLKCKKPKKKKKTH